MSVPVLTMSKHEFERAVLLRRFGDRPVPALARVAGSNRHSAAGGNVWRDPAHHGHAALLSVAGATIPLSGVAICPAPRYGQADG
jgi:hypothetical protein